MKNTSKAHAALLLAAALSNSVSALAQTKPEGAPTFADSDVVLKTATGTLYGSELVPKAAGKIPVVLLHSGSGPTDRNGNSRALPGANNSLKMLAEALAKEGIASVRFDKRGIGQSAPAMVGEADMRFENYVDDAASWIKQLKADARFSKIIVAGHSEGALVGMLAVKQAGADGYVSIAGIARAADDVLRDQLKPKLPSSLYEDADRALKSLKAGNTVADAPPALASLFRPSVQPYLISWMKYTPSEFIKELKVPALVLQGSADIQVEVAEATALGRAKPDAELVIIEGMNHVLKMVGTDAEAQARSYGDSTMPVSRQLVAEISGFVKRLK
jgi:uncharacterized protein